MLRISPQPTGGSIGYILLNPSERIHQDALLTYLNSAGRVVHVLPCPNFDNFLQSNFLCPCDNSFLSNLPYLGYLLSMEHHILQYNNYSQDVPPNLSWLPAVPSNPSVLSNLTIVQETPWREVHPYVNARVPPKTVDRGPHCCPNPNGVDFKSITSYQPPVPYAIRGHLSFGSFSPLTTSFNVSVHGGSCDQSFNGGYCHGRHHPPRMGGHFRGGLSVALSIARSLKPVSLDLSDTTLSAPVPVPAPAPIPKAQPLPPQLLTHSPSTLSQSRISQGKLFKKRIFCSQSRTSHRTLGSSQSRTRNPGSTPGRSSTPGM
jgi:hypothetical protein